MPDFIPGRELSRLFYVEAVKPLLDAEFPDLRYDAALIDSGSEVLGFDTEMSRDHHWGPRLSIFVSAADYPQVADAIRATMGRGLPYHFRGYSTSFEPIPGEQGTLRFVERSAGEISHRVTVGVLRDFVGGYLGFDVSGDDQRRRLADLPSAKAAHDHAGGGLSRGLGEVDALRARLDYYPRDVWLYLLAAQWMRISQEEPFVGRTGDVGDELGSRVIAARLIRDVMLLAS